MLLISLAVRHHRRVTAGLPASCEVLQWSAQQTLPQRRQSIPHPGLSSVHPFTAPSGISERSANLLFCSLIYSSQLRITVFVSSLQLILC